MRNTHRSLLLSADDTCSRIDVLNLFWKSKMISLFNKMKWKLLSEGVGFNFEMKSKWT